MKRRLNYRNLKSNHKREFIINLLKGISQVNYKISKVLYDLDLVSTRLK